MCVFFMYRIFLEGFLKIIKSDVILGYGGVMWFLFWKKGKGKRDKVLVNIGLIFERREIKIGNVVIFAVYYL